MDLQRVVVNDYRLESLRQMTYVRLARHAIMCRACSMVHLAVGRAACVPARKILSDHRAEEARLRLDQVDQKAS